MHAAQALIGYRSAYVRFPAKGERLCLPILEDEWIIVQLIGGDCGSAKFNDWDEARAYAEAELTGGRCQSAALITKFALNQRTDIYATDLATLDDGVIAWRGFEAFA